MIVSSASPLSRIVVAISRWSSDSGVSSSTPLMPITPFIGVRISWLIVARKALLASLAASAAARASRRRCTLRSCSNARRMMAPRKTSGIAAESRTLAQSLDSNGRVSIGTKWSTRLARMSGPKTAASTANTMAPTAPTRCPSRHTCHDAAIPTTHSRTMRRGKTTVEGARGVDLPQRDVQQEQHARDEHPAVPARCALAQLQQLRRGQDGEQVPDAIPDGGRPHIAGQVRRQRCADELPFAEGEPGEERGKDELATVAAEHAQHGRHQRDDGIEEADTQVDEAVVPIGLHGPGQVRGHDGHDAATLHVHEHRAILGAKGRKQRAHAAELDAADDDLLARAGMARRGERAAGARVTRRLLSPGGGWPRPGSAVRSARHRCAASTGCRRHAAAGRLRRAASRRPAGQRASSQQRRHRSGSRRGRAPARARSPPAATAPGPRARRYASRRVSRCRLHSASTSASTRIGLVT